jgi:cyclophilin family peptidyl-prolyl cis-trans isomerase/HEAT repeat protein
MNKRTVRFQNSLLFWSFNFLRRESHPCSAQRQPKNMYMMRAFRYIVPAFLILGVASCIPETVLKTAPEKISLDFEDQGIRTILDLQDKLDSTALLPYLRHANPNYRYASALAFSAIKSEKAIDSLAVLLSDPIEEVRTAAAHSIGQSGIARAASILKSHFRSKDSINVNNRYNSTVLEGVGKTGTLEDLKLLATVKTYRNNDTLLLLGQARAIFRMSLRKLVADEGTDKMVELVSGRDIPQEIRMIAAHYLSRNKTLPLTNYRIILSAAINREKNPEIVAQLATAFGNTKDSLFLPVLRKTLAESKDYKVKMHTLKALGNFRYSQIRQELLSYLDNQNVHVAAAAAGVLMYNGATEDIPLYLKYDTSTVAWPVRSKICGAVLVHTPFFNTKSKGAYSQKIYKILQKEDSPYAKAAFADALSRDPFNYLLLVQLFRESKNPIVRIAALEGLGKIVKSPSYYLALGKESKLVRSVMFKTFSQAIESGDAGQIAAAATILKDPAGNWRGWMKDTKSWVTILSRLTIPQMIEAYNELEAVIALAENRPAAPKVPEYNHPIDWTLFKTIADTSVLSVKTNKGNILIELFKKQAPATVTNFIGLAREGFFKGRIFHRVVPNFVIQTGCPRGDGYGSLDYSIRSELPQTYYNTEGLLGMASAGVHTEGTQWFITHCATPHLDGRYTLFGRVKEGMDVVHSMEQGDKIIEVLLVK